MMNLNQAHPTIRVQQTQTLSLNITQRYKQAYILFSPGNLRHWTSPSL